MGKKPDNGKGKPRLRDSLHVFQYRDFRLYFAGQLVSTVGSYMQSVALAWLVYRLTHSAVLLGAVVFAGQIPVFLLAPFCGLLADRVARRRIVLLCETTSMVLSSSLAFLTLAGRIQIWEIFAIGALSGTVNAFNFPARQALIADLVKKEDLIHAIPLNSSMINSARIAGPALAGLVVAAIGEGWCFFVNAASYIAVIAALVMIKAQTRRMTLHAHSIFANLKEGFSFAFRTGPDLALLVLLGVISFWGMRFDVLLPIFADKILHGGPSALGLLMGASGIGAVAASLALAAQNNIRDLGGWIALASGGFGISLILFSVSHFLWLSIALLGLAGFTMVAQLDSSSTLLQEMVPDELRGRVTSIWTMMLTGIGPFGALITGALAHQFGAVRTLAAGGTACVMGAMVFGFYLPIFRTRAIEMMGLPGGLASAAAPAADTPAQRGS